MSILRRQAIRLLRLRNLLILTVVVMLIYIIKLLGEGSVGQLHSEAQLLRSGDLAHHDYFVPTSLKKIDWHNYDLINYEKTRVGIGEQGLPAHLPAEDHALEEELYLVNGFNGALSDRIPLNRSLPDIRHPGCRDRRYLESLPTVSVVVPFHNEHWSTLLRTAHSVLQRSPDHLLKELFLVDDASTKEFLKEKLDAYVSAHLPRARVLRLARRGGLIAARLAGAARAAGDVLVFLDAHTEPNVNWLPPLLEPIALSPRTAVCPFIDVVAFDTFEYRAQDEGARGAFDWEFFYKRLPVLPRDQQNMPEPFESPVMAGGLFAISRKFFWELGGYDPGLDIWGGEQYELSFKIWQCGGRMVDAPCSRVGHIYRKFAPFPNPGHGDFVGKNYRRVAEVWMDDYAEFLYQRRPHYRAIDPGDISEQRALRERLRCKSFRWFITQVAFDLTAKYPPVEPQPFAEGHVSPALNSSLCVDARRAPALQPLRVRACGAPGAEQDFVFSWHKDIRSADRSMCWDLPEAAPGSSVLLYSCHLGGGNQLWRYREDTGQIRHGDGDKCVEWAGTGTDTARLQVAPCSGAPEQRWRVQRVHAARLARWDERRDRLTGPVEQY